MFNILKTKVKEPDMGWFAKLRLGALALDVAGYVRDVVSSIDPEAALRVAFKVVEIERERRGIPGAQKLTELLEWFATNYPGGNASVVVGYVRSIVSLLNALGVFAK